MTGRRESLGDIASHFPVLPGRLADALDDHGASAYAWAWIEDGRLLRLEVES